VQVRVRVIVNSKVWSRAVYKRYNKLSHQSKSLYFTLLPCENWCQKWDWIAQTATFQTAVDNYGDGTNYRMPGGQNKNQLSQEGCQSKGSKRKNENQPKMDGSQDSGQ
jgi:hypothetical protein